MALHEIVLPETKPETEWVGGRALQKVSPTYVRTYLRAGTSAVFVIDPHERTIVIYDGRPKRTLRSGDVLTHVAMPGFSLDVTAFFERAFR